MEESIENDAASPVRPGVMQSAPLGSLLTLFCTKYLPTSSVPSAAPGLPQIWEKVDWPVPTGHEARQAEVVRARLVAADHANLKIENRSG